MHGVGRAGRYQTNVQHAARLPCVALVDRIALPVEQVRTVEMRALLHRPSPIVVHAPAPAQDAAGRVARLQLEPHVERIHGACREEMTYLPRTNHRVYPHGLAGLEPDSRRSEEHTSELQSRFGISYA